MRSLAVLLLCDGGRAQEAIVAEQIAALRQTSRHNVTVFNPRGVPTCRAMRFDQFDAVVTHWSLILTSEAYLAPAWHRALRSYAGLKAHMIQDEYRWVDHTTAALRDLGYKVLFSVVPPESAGAIYGPRLTDVKLIFTLPGYVPRAAESRQSPPSHERPLDVVYRGRELPAWLGRLANDKARIGRDFLACSGPYGLKCDIAWTETARLYGKEWTRFLESGRATLGTESGASIVDFDGSIEKRVQAFLRDHPHATFSQVEEAVLSEYAGPAIATVSPRIFEAAATRTALVLFAGEYSGVLKPWRHYVPLADDLSNIGEIAPLLRDYEFLDELTSRTHDDLIAGGHYGQDAFVGMWDNVLSDEASMIAASGPTTIRMRAAEVERCMPAALWRRSAQRVGHELHKVARHKRSGSPLRRCLGVGAEALLDVWKPIRQ